MARFQKIAPFLWFNGQAEEAASFYVSVFKNSRVKQVVGPPGAAMVVTFELEGLGFVALNGGPAHKFTEATSFVVNCKNQKEVDYFWEKLTSGGGSEGDCGWLKDRFGLSRQDVPEALPKALSNPATSAT